MKRSSNITSLLLVSSTLGFFSVSCASAPKQPKQKDPLYANGMRSVASLTKQRPTFEPWASQKFAPVIGERATVRSKKTSSILAAGPLQATGYLAFKFYQHTFSAVDGQTCRFSPTCSRFGLDAIRAHGIWGIPLTFARLHKNHLDESFYENEGFSLKDPVDNYTFPFSDAILDSFALFKDPDHGWYIHVHAVEDLEHPSR